MNININMKILPSPGGSVAAEQFICGRYHFPLFCSGYICPEQFCQVFAPRNNKTVHSVFKRCFHAVHPFGIQHQDTPHIDRFQECILAPPSVVFDRRQVHHILTCFQEFFEVLKLLTKFPPIVFFKIGVPQFMVHVKVVQGAVYLDLPFFREPVVCPHHQVCVLVEVNTGNRYITGFAIYEEAKWVAITALVLGSLRKFITNFFSED